MAVTRQQLEQQLVAAHRTKNVQAAQQAAYAIRAYDQNVLSAQVPSINAPPPIDRVPKPTFGSYIEDISRGMGRGFVTQLEGMQQLVTHPYDTGKALIQAGVEAVRNPSQAIGEAWSGIKSQAQTAMSSPQGFGQVLGENLDFIPGPGGKRRPTMAELDVYHGTPHTFDPETGAPLGRFRSSKIGTGEGAQAYGYGLYFAESPDVAGEYRDRLSTKVTVNGSQLQTIPSDSPSANAHNMVVTNVQKGLSPKDAIAATKKYWTDAANEMLALVESHPELAERIKKEASSRMEIANSAASLKPESFYRHPGSLYKVDLPDAKIEQMLDWDKPISQQPAMQKAFTKFWKGLSKDERAQAVFDEFGDYDLAEQMAKSPGEVRGRLAYTLMTHHLGDQAAASDFLRQQGVPGIKYLDAGSRKGEKGTRNFVVFPGEEQSLTILERN